MWEVAIGSGDHGCCSIIIPEYRDGDFSISQNGVSYWVSHAFMRFGMVIFKNTEVGQTIKKMIEDKEPVANVRKLVERSILPLLDPQELRQAINSEISKAETRGRNQKINEILAVLSKE